MKSRVLSGVGDGIVDDDGVWRSEFISKERTTVEGNQRPNVEVGWRNVINPK